MKAVVVLPTKNEAKSVEAMVSRIKALKLPVFIVDESSTDGTIEKAKALGVEVFQRKGRGKGFGIIEGLEIAERKGFDAVAIIDCDQTYPIEMIPRMIGMLKEKEMIVGARPMESIVFIHRMGNMVHTMAINLLFGARLTDANSGQRVFWTRDLLGKLDAKGFDIEVDITIKALKNGVKIIEVPIEYKERIGISKILWRDGAKILWKIIKERFS